MAGRTTAQKRGYTMDELRHANQERKKIVTKLKRNQRPTDEDMTLMERFFGSSIRSWFPRG